MEEKNSEFKKIDVAKSKVYLGDIYLRYAFEHKIEAEKAFNNCMKKGKGEQRIYLYKERDHSIYSIIFSALALEGIINEIGRSRLEKTIWKKFERLRIKEKYMIFPKFISGNTFDCNSKLFKDFERLISLRNKLVHFKDFEYTPLINHPCGKDVDDIFNIANSKNAEVAFGAANNMVKELMKLIRP